MQNINLLPWRKYKREQIHESFKREILASIFLGLIIIMFWHIKLTHQIQSLQQKTSPLPKLQLPIKQTNIARLLQELNLHLPKNTYLNFLQINAGTILLHGTITNTADIPQLLFANNVTLNEIRQTPSGTSFILTMQDNND